MEALATNNMYLLQYKRRQELMIVALVKQTKQNTRLDSLDINNLGQIMERIQLYEEKYLILGQFSPKCNIFWTRELTVERRINQLLIDFLMFAKGLLIRA